MQVVLRYVLAILLLHHLEGFVFGFVTAFIVNECCLHFPVMNLMLVRVSGTGVVIGKAELGFSQGFKRVLQQGGLLIEQVSDLLVFLITFWKVNGAGYIFE